VVGVLHDYVGPRAAETVETVLERVEVPELLTPESIITLVLLLFGATAVFSNVRGSLNTIWGVGPKDESLWDIVKGYLRTRLRGFLMIALTGVVLAVSFTVSSMVGVLGGIFEERLSQGWLLVRAMDIALSLLVTGALFGAIYRTLPAVRIEWSTVWVGAFATALIFVIGKALVAWLIASASWTSYYGPGASVVAFLAWIYFSAQLFFLGAEFTQVWSRRRGGVMHSLASSQRASVGRADETTRASATSARPSPARQTPVKRVGFRK
jgi:membrane protein